MHELRPILAYLRPYRGGIAIGIACTALANVLQIAAPYLTKLVIDGLSDSDVTAGRIALLGALIVLAAAVGGSFRYVMRQLMNGISRRVEADLRNDFFRHLLALDATYYGTIRTGDLMSRATNDSSSVRQAIGPSVMYLVNTGVTAVFALGLMFWISPRLTVLAMVPMVLVPPVMLVFGRAIHRRHEEIQERFASLSTFVQENFTGVRIVRAYTQEDDQSRLFEQHNGEYRAQNMALVRVAGLFHPLLGAFSGIAMVVVMWVGANEIIAGRMTIGDFVAFSLYLSNMVWPMIALGWVVNGLQRGAASMGRINEVMRAVPLVAPPARPVALVGLKGEITFRDVSFTYPGSERVVLDGVNFTVRGGETIAIVGPTGSGKSTLVSLLARLYDPTRGEIRLDGVPLTDIDPRELRRHVGVVPQDTFLFSDTIEHNIALGLGAAQASDTEERAATVRRAAAVAQLHDQIEAFPNQYATMLGERGINLSGGQKQRAALARALARLPAVIVLDDALSAVDTHTEAAILGGLKSALRGTTAFIISHRVSAIMHADQILVLEEGRVVERGRHADLLAAGGTYARLLRRQLLEEDLESVVA